MAKHRHQPNQYTFSFADSSLPPMSAEHAAIVHGHLTPPGLIAKKESRQVLPSAAVGEPDGMPVPRPLDSAVARGVFGVDEQGEPIDPSADEIQDITKHHAETLTDLLDDARNIDERLERKTDTFTRQTLLRDQDRVRCRIQSVVALYAEDFGETAARHLQSWAALQLDHDASSAEPGEVSAEISPAPSPKQNPHNDRQGKPKSRAASSPAEKAEKIDRLHETVDQALDRLAESLEAGKSDTLKAWLTTMSRFHDYSFNNQMLIAWQRPDATRVAGFHAWKNFNRLVNKGEKGIMILAPVTRPVAKVEEKDEQGNTKEKTIRRIVNTKIVYVFDISQTHGEPLPEFARVKGDAAADHLPALKEFIAAKAIELYFAEKLSGGAQGRSEGGRIGCVKGLTPAEEFRTLTHEVGHELLHRGERREQTTRRSRELEAEAVAFVVCTAIGLDARECSTDYIHLYRGNKQMLTESLQFIRQVSNEILAVLLPAENQKDSVNEKRS
jgi:hypothetical protein